MIQRPVLKGSRMARETLTDGDGKPLQAGGSNLPLERCPHCGIARPLLGLWNQNVTQGRGGHRRWLFHTCTICGGMVIAATYEGSPGVIACYPSLPGIDGNIPERGREYLRQARESLGQAAASIMVCASAIDAMLKAKGLTKGSLYDRIDQAAADHRITSDMAKWAHQVRLDANDQRHADESAPLPTTEDAQRCFDFAMALAEVLFVLPARVTRGIQQTAAGKS